MLAVQLKAMEEKKRAELDRLFEQMRLQTDQENIQKCQAEIWQLWLDIDEPEADEFMRQGLHHLSENEYDAAISAFNSIITRYPLYAEGWNKRATAYYMRGSFKHAIEDLKQVLQLEPRHFGALSGLASIYLETQLLEEAEKMLNLMLQLTPYDNNVIREYQELQKRLREE